MSKISIVIRCYNEEKHIGRLLRGVLAQTQRDVEIVLVDSGSTDRTLSIAERYPIRVVRIRPAEFSFGRALNLGCEAATGDLLVFASAHVYPVYRDWIERLVEPFSAPDVALVYGRQRGCESTRFSEHQVFARWFPATGACEQSHPFCNNANAAVRRSIWERFPYDEQLTGLEDLDWAKRALRAGLKIVYEPDAEIVHVHEESARRIFNRYRREAIALKQIYPEEQFGLLDFVRFYTSNVAADCVHAFHDRVLMRSTADILTFRLMQFWGAYRGFAQRGQIGRDLRARFYYPNGFSRSMEAVPEEPGRRIEYAATAGEY